MNVDKTIWEERMYNLINRERGTKGNSDEAVRLRDYRAHLNKIFIGESLLDVGCGDGNVKKHLNEVRYVGIDAFPLNDSVIKMYAEKIGFKDKEFDTVICFAALDNFMDLRDSISEMKRVCAKNIAFLTGIYIKPDKYHTLQIKEHELDILMSPFKVTYRENFGKNVILIEYTR